MPSAPSHLLRKTTRRMHLLALLSFGLLMTPVAVHADEKAPTIYIIGDSTAANKSNDKHPEKGWGQLFRRLVIAPAKLSNRALNGRSTKSFIAEKQWDKVMDSLKAGDWVIIQFGHNDQKENKPSVYAPARGAYRDNLNRFIKEIRERGAHPVLATSVARRSWDEKGRHLNDTLGEYPVVTRELAKEKKVPLLELNRLTTVMEEEAGVEGSKKFHLWFAPGEHPAVSKGIQDDTHYSELGARRVAGLAAAEIHRLDLPLGKWIKKPN